ncbi:MAG: hypothetical protein LLG04_11180 [Parachlamydia sp.]|nr:hypothetical protein [Parachlamydia sp.]
MEIKIKLDSKSPFEQVFEFCCKIFDPPTSHVLQLDQYYDTADGQLGKQDLVARTSGS